MSARLPVIPRPVTRGDCANVPRPCPFTDCRYNLSERAAHSCGGRGKRRSITDGDMAQIVAWYMSGVSVSEIQRRTKYTHAGIRGALIRAGHKKGRPKQFSCALDAADLGGMEDREIGAELGITGQAVNLIVQRALAKLKRVVPGDLRDYLADGPDGWTEPEANGEEDE